MNPTTSYTAEFHEEFEAERDRWLCRRFLRYTLVMGVLASLVGVNQVADAMEGGSVPGAARVDWLDAGMSWASAGAFFWANVFVRRNRVGRERVLDYATWLVVGVGVLLFVHSAAEARVERERGAYQAWRVLLLLAHAGTCAFLPWKPWESIRPIIPLVGLGVFFELFLRRAEAPLSSRLFGACLTPLVAVPGVLITWARQRGFRRKFTTRMFRFKYHEMRKELASARQIHESLFPPAIDDGPVRMGFAYEPMRQIGGDFLYAARGADDALSVVLMDVTGHGIAAALTVNRLHGELDRIFAEDPAVEPGEVLRLLNRYVHLTLATHSVYLTAVCVRVEPRANRVRYASGGHPPAFLRAVDGTLEELSATSLVLGACADADFEPEPRVLRFGPGDTLIAYTDGAIEAADPDGAMLGVAGLRRVVSGLARGDRWADRVRETVAMHRAGPPRDDLLVVEITRPV